MSPLSAGYLSGGYLSPRYRGSIELPVPVERAFAFVSDLRHAARWDPRVERAEMLDEGPPRVGTRFLLVSPLGRWELELPYEITALTEPERLVLEGRTRLLRYRDEIGFQALEGGAGARLSYDARLSLRGPLALANPLLARALGRIGDDALAGIRRSLLAEARRQGWPGAPAPTRAPTPEEVRRTVAMDDRPVLRNLRITQGYHRLSQALDQVLGGGHANWCTYAAWASKTAGTFIREEELRGEFRRLLEAKGRVRRRLRRCLREVHRALRGVEGEDVEADLAQDLGPVLGAIDEVGRFIREGNRTVFEELGGLFAQLLVELEGHPEPEPERFEGFLEQLRPGESGPDEIVVEGDRLVSRPRGGQDRLAGSMRAYYAARFETDPKRKAELILFANALGGLHEQTRLQGFIVGALEAPVAEVLHSRVHDALARRLGRQLPGPAREALHRSLAPLAEEVTERARELTTRFLMRLPVPGEVLELGEDHPAPRGGPLYPELLERIEHADLARLLDRSGAEPIHLRGLPLPARLRAFLAQALVRLRLRRPVAAGSAARDWGELPERIRYILVYFRSRQAWPSLLDPPFDPAQTAAIEAGEVPGGAL